MPLGHVVEVNAFTLDGVDGARLTASWRWTPALLSAGDVGDLARGWFAALEALVGHAEQPGAGGRTPSDLPLIALSQSEIEGLEGGTPEIEDLLPLSRLQEGLLFHALYDAQAPDVYTTQLVLGLEGALDEGVLRAAAGALLRRHASLRVGFQHANLSRPVAIVVPRVEVPWRSIDLSMLDGAGRAEALGRLVAVSPSAPFADIPVPRRTDDANQPAPPRWPPVLPP